VALGAGVAGQIPRPRACFGATTLANLVECLSGFAPARGSDGFEEASEPQLAAFGNATRAMLASPCATEPPRALADLRYAIREFEDDATGRSYCVLFETIDEAQERVERGWGTVVVAREPGPWVHALGAIADEHAPDVPRG
jgi:hypothetical protein